MVKLGYLAEEWDYYHVEADDEKVVRKGLEGYKLEQSARRRIDTATKSARDHGVHRIFRLQRTKRPRKRQKSNRLQRIPSPTIISERQSTTPENLEPDGAGRCLAYTYSR